jgi:hypothetical protein
MPLSRTDAAMFEYACHEGNYAMTNTLGGARVQEGSSGTRGKGVGAARE